MMRRGARGGGLGGRSTNNSNGPGALAMEAQVFVTNLNGKTLTIDVDLEKHTVLDVKKAIQQRETKLVAEKQRLIYCGKILDDARSLKYYNVERNKTLHLVVRLPGGW